MRERTEYNFTARSTNLNQKYIKNEFEKKSVNLVKKNHIQSVQNNKENET